MIALIRAFSKTIYAKLLLGVLVIAMGAFGLQGVFADQLTTAVITAGPRQVMPKDFNRFWNNTRQRGEERMGRPVMPEEMVAEGVHRAIAEQLATRASFAAWMQEARLRPADELLVSRISEIPGLFNPITKKLDEARFAELLSNNNMTKREFDVELRDQVAISHWQTGLGMGLQAPRMYSAAQVAFGLERRDVTWFPVTPGIAGIPQPPTDAQLTAFINENQDRLRRPEFRQITLVLFRPAHYADRISLDEAQVRQIYESRKAAMAQAERRTFTQITLGNPQLAPRVAAALRAGQDPAAVARAVGGQLVTYTEKPQTAVPDPIVGRTVFGMTAGQVSDPIRGQLGVAVVKLTAVAPGREVSFEEARPDIERAMRTEEAAERVFNAVDAYERARAAGASIGAAAQQVGAEVRTLPFAVTKNGLTMAGQRVGAPDAVFQEAFDLPPGGESDSAKDGGQGAYFAVRVDKVIPAGLPTLANDRPMLTGAWMGFEVERRMRTKANELMARISRGESVAAVAASVGAPVQTTAGLERSRHPLFSPLLLGEIFLKKSGEAFSNRMNAGPQMPVPPYVVGRVDAIRTPPPAIAARLAENTRLALSQQIMEEMAQMAESWAREKVKPKIRTDRIDKLVGADQAAAAAPAGKKK